ncbi:MAG: helix-turn-helix transcriptional regulator [Ruminococcaceae bacterium]|nr:helix-turn-helix transcriptional regulator [Oscillospiraceae bacterium]
MTDKKSFGAFIKEKRTEKNYSQRDLAEMLFVTEGAVSKWERGVSYPDITMISEICRALDISEHELITASTDEDAKKIKKEARSFRTIRSAWFWVPTISYSVALLVCFICNIAVNHTLSWFFIVLSALICAYTFVPTISIFFESKRLISFAASTYLSICLLLFTCAIYTERLSWLLTACIGILIGYVLVFVPILLSNTRLARYKFIISFTGSCVLTVLLLVNVHLWHPFNIVSAILISLYAFAPAILSTVICAFKLDPFLKAGICTALSAVAYYFIEFMIDLLFGTNDSSYQVDFSDWTQCVEGNVQAIILIVCLLISAVFIAIGAFRIYKRKSD